jgi:Domain of unknown function (DUF6456)
MTKARNALPSSAERFLAALAGSEPGAGAKPSTDADTLARLLSADLVTVGPNRQIEITAAGRSHLARLKLARGAIEIDPFLGQHLDLARRSIATPHGRAEVTIDNAESPLAWLARRKDRSGRPLIAAEQLQAGEKLRAQFTAANLTPRTTSNWSAPIAQSAGASGAAVVADVIVTARQQIRRALDAAGPEFAGLLIDVCCFLKGLEDVERERGWPARSAKVVLQLGLDRLARHYGFAAQARGRPRAAVRTWLAPDVAFVVDGT